MEKSKIEERIEKLRAQINYHNYRYHALDSPEISDADYDELMIELKELEIEHPQFVTPDSPTQRVGVAPVETFGLVEHPRPLLSLANAFSKDELLLWYSRALKLAGDQYLNFTCEHKIDGLAVALTYINGQLTIGATRGDGLRGENITQNLKTIKSIPLSVLKEAPPRFEVRGEVFLSKTAFHTLNRERESLGLPLFANPRNAAAGSVRQLDPRITTKRPLDIYIYALGWSEGKVISESHWETLEYLKSLGFKVSPHNARLTTIDQVEEYYQSWMHKRESLPYEADGIVAKLDSIPLQKRLGFVGHEPRWAIAYKFPSIQGTTQLREIRISVGRTGTLNPYAALEPVSIGGVTIERAALHNEDDIRRKDIREGDWVYVRRAGDVIPDVVGPIESRRTHQEKQFNLLDKIFDKSKGRPACPVCSAEVHKPEGEVMYYCSNTTCPAQLHERLQHFASRGSMDIRGIGEQMSIALLTTGLVKNVADLYYLTKADLIKLKSTGEKSVHNILNAINKSKGTSLPRFILALGIRHIGYETAQLLATHFYNIDELANASREELISIPTVGPKITDSIIAFFKLEENMRTIQRLKDAGVNPRVERSKHEILPLTGKEFVITGRLELFSKKEAEAQIKALGGIAKSDITQMTTYLVVGADPGSKLARAQVLGTKQLTEEEFLRLLREVV
ncbi:NAD-dependent DNA ligase LigA [Chloroflexota bacterium]